MERERASAPGGVTGPGQARWKCVCIGTSLNFRILPWNDLEMLVMNRESSDGQEDYRRGAIIEVIQLGNSWD